VNPFAAPDDPASRYWAARELLPRVPTAFQGSKCVRRELKRRKYQDRARYQVRANTLLPSGALAFTWYCHNQYCTVFGIQRGGRGTRARARQHRARGSPTELSIGLYMIRPELILSDIVWCLVYTRGVEEGSYIAQSSCNTIARLWAMQVGQGNTRVTDSCIKASK